MRPIVLATPLCLATARAQPAEDVHSRERLVPSFPSTGGPSTGGPSTGSNAIMISEYRPAVHGDTCSTDFTATEPNGTVHRNRVVFDAISIQGRILCTNGRWNSPFSDARGTTPFPLYFKGGIAHRSP